MSITLRLGLIEGSLNWSGNTELCVTATDVKWMRGCPVLSEIVNSHPSSHPVAVLSSSFKSRPNVSDWCRAFVVLEMGLNELFARFAEKI